MPELWKQFPPNAPPVHGFNVEGHFIYRANGTTAPTWCGLTLDQSGGFRLLFNQPITCRTCWNHICRAAAKTAKGASK